MFRLATIERFKPCSWSERDSIYCTKVYKRFPFPSFPVLHFRFWKATGSTLPAEAKKRENLFNSFSNFQILWIFSRENLHEHEELSFRTHNSLTVEYFWQTTYSWFERCGFFDWFDNFIKWTFIFFHIWPMNEINRCAKVEFARK